MIREGPNIRHGMGAIAKADKQVGTCQAGVKAGSTVTLKGMFCMCKPPALPFMVQDRCLLEDDAGAPSAWTGARQGGACKAHVRTAHACRFHARIATGATAGCWESELRGKACVAHVHTALCLAAHFLSTVRSLCGHLSGMSASEWHALV